MSNNVQKKVTRQFIDTLKNYGLLTLVESVSAYAEDGDENQKKRIADAAVIFQTDLDTNKYPVLKLLTMLNRTEKEMISSFEPNLRHWWLDGFITALVSTKHPKQTPLQSFLLNLLEAIHSNKEGWGFEK